MLKPLAFALSDDPRAALAWRCALALLLGTVTWLALSPAPPPAAGLLWDKLNHLSAFAGLAVAARLAFRRGKAWVAPALLAYGGAIEILQSFTPNRVGEWPDLLADALGIALGLALAAVLLRRARPARA